MPPPYQPYISNVLDVVQPSPSPSVHPLLPSGYADLPPPSYEDAIAAFEDGSFSPADLDRVGGQLTNAGLKTLMLIGILLMLLQAFSSLFKNIANVKNRKI